MSGRFRRTSAVAVLLAGFLTAVSANAQQVVNLWPAGSPTLQGANEKEITAPPNSEPGQRINSIKNVHVPSIEVHLAPPDLAVGTAIIVAPGGGHSQLVWGSEGTDIVKWLNGIGVSAFILKYRLAQTAGYHYTVEGEALQDTQRAVRIARSRAKEWGVHFSMQECRLTCSSMGTAVMAAA
jgi:endo-1,4-beta-xylanase